MLALALHHLNAALSALHATRCTPQPPEAVVWGWRMQLALSGLLLPVLIEVLGLAWPLLNLGLYEQRFQQVHQVGAGQSEG